MEIINKTEQVIKNEEVVNKTTKNKSPESRVMENFDNLFYYGQAKQAVRIYLGKTLDEYNVYDAYYNKKDKKHFENFYLKSSKNPRDLLKITFLNRRLFRIDVIKKEKDGRIDKKYAYVTSGVCKVSFNNIKNTYSISKADNGKLTTNIYDSNSNKLIKTLVK